MVVMIVGMTTNIVSGCDCAAPGVFFNCYGPCENGQDCLECQGNCEGCDCA